MRRFVILACLTFIFSTGLGFTATRTMTIKVQAGKHDRVQEPVRVLVSLPKEFQGVQSLVLYGADGTRAITTGQLTAPGLRSETSSEVTGKRELHFVLPSLKAEKSLTLLARLDSSTTSVNKKGQQFRWHDTRGKHTELRFGKRPVLRYMYTPLDTSSKKAREETYKVFHHVYSPDGSRLVTKGPGGKYTHHRGLFYGFKKVTYGDGKKVDIWSCRNAHQQHEKVLSQEEGPVLGRHRVQIGWHGQGQKVFAREQRELTAYAVQGGTLLQFVSRLETAGGPVVLDGDPQHAGFHFRADNEVASKTSKQTIYTRPDGVGKPGATRNWSKKNPRHANLPWNAMTFVLGEQRYTAAYLDHPENPKEARYSERPYGRFGSYFVATVTEKKPVVVRYRIWLQNGPMTVKEVARRSQSFVAPVKVTVE